MIEYSTPVSDEQKAFLAKNKFDLCEDPKLSKAQKEAGRKLWTHRLKNASDAYNVAKAQHTLFDLDGVPDDDGDPTDAIDPLFPVWSVYRDNFLLEWIGNRIVVTEKEADMIFERTAEEALQAIEQAEQNGTETVAETPTVAETTAPTTAEEPVAPKRRGRPPGSGKKTAAAVVKSTKTAKKKVAAKKKSVNKGSASAKAQAIIEKYAARDWSRKDIIGKLQAQLGMGAAYASTLYQKYA